MLKSVYFKLESITQFWYTLWIWLVIYKKKNNLNLNSY